MDGGATRWLLTTLSGLTGLSRQNAWVLSGLIFGGLLPTIFLLLWRRWQKPGRAIFFAAGRAIAWRYVVIAYLVALPPLLWLASRPGFRHYYAASLERGLATTALRFALVLVAEHICIQGLIFVLALPDMADRPPAAPVASGARGSDRLRRFLGLGPGWSLRSFELNAALLIAMAVQAWVFGWVHFSKDAGELLLSFPGGFALGYLAWRGRSIWPCVVLHAATGLTVIALSLLLF